jgi:hypothetical protein
LFDYGKRFVEGIGLTVAGDMLQLQVGDTSVIFLMEAIFFILMETEHQP